MSHDTAELIVGTAGAKPEIIKQIKDGDLFIGGEKDTEGNLLPTDFVMVSDKQNLDYNLWVHFGDNVLGYDKLVIRDDIDRALIAGAGVQFTLIGFDSNGEFDSIETLKGDGVSMQTPSSDNRFIELTLDRAAGFDFAKLRNKSLLIEYTAKIDRDYLQGLEDVSAYSQIEVEADGVERSAFKIPNLAWFS